MADHGLWKTTELSPLLAQRGVNLSPAQVYRLVTGRPERLSLPTLAALCDILDCTPADLIEITATTSRPTARAKPGRAAARRPRRARIADEERR